MVGAVLLEVEYTDGVFEFLPTYLFVFLSFDSFVCQRWRGGVHPISKSREKDTLTTLYAAGSSSDVEKSAVLPTAKLSLFEESTSTTDANDVSDDEEAVQVWIQMRTMQIALESQNPNLKKACLDVDENNGQEVAETFNIRSGLSPCDECRSCSQGVSFSAFLR